MKISGAEIAKAMMASKAGTQPDKDEPQKMIDETKLGHIDHMSKFIEAVHSKDSQMAHDCLMEYSRHAAAIDKDDE